MGTDAQRVRVIDSHTGGEPTRVILSGGPDLGEGTIVDRRRRLELDHDEFRAAIVGEPRSSEATVGALLCDLEDPSCLAGVIFFDSAGYLGMCGHGTIGLMATLAHLGRAAPGTHGVETPVGRVVTQLHESGEVTFTNVASYRVQHAVSVDVPDVGVIVGDVAWGGNWFFLVDRSPIPLVRARIPELTSFSLLLRKRLREDGIRGGDGEAIRHVALYDEQHRSAGVDSRNFVLCPDGTYDRSPCGTGTSARLACLYADGRLEPGQSYRQESIVGSCFDGRVEAVEDGRVMPSITGSAYVVAESELWLDPRDPFGHGFVPEDKRSARQVSASREK